MAWFMKKPVERAPSTAVFGVPLFVSGMMVSAFALRATRRGMKACRQAVRLVGIVALGLVQPCHRCDGGD